MQSWCGRGVKKRAKKSWCTVMTVKGMTIWWQPTTRWLQIQRLYDCLIIYILNSLKSGLKINFLLHNLNQLKFKFIRLPSLRISRIPFYLVTNDVHSWHLSIRGRWFDKTCQQKLVCLHLWKPYKFFSQHDRLASTLFMSSHVNSEQINIHL